MLVETKGGKDISKTMVERTRELRNLLGKDDPRCTSLGTARQMCLKPGECVAICEIQQEVSYTPNSSTAEAIVGICCPPGRRPAYSAQEVVEVPEQSVWRQQLGDPEAIRKSLVW